MARNCVLAGIAGQWTSGSGISMSHAFKTPLCSLLAYILVLCTCKGQFRVLSMRTLPAAGNGESCLGPPSIDYFLIRINTVFRYAYVRYGNFRIFWTK